MPKFKFSVIIPVYKVEEYLEETIESVINQTIGFKKNIQIILVNDGSPDNSEEICLKYQEKYPQNIFYYKQKNSGVSAARNEGLKHADGKYINFLDSDDKWEKNVFAKAWKMFEKDEEISVIGVRQKYFEASTGYPSLDYKFDKDKVINILEDYDHIQLSVTSAFIRASMIENAIYDTRIKYSEDAKFLCEILLRHPKMGIIASSNHLYRKRLAGNSAIQTKNTKDDWFLITPELGYKYCADLSKKLYGRVIEYVQYYIAYDYQWRIQEKIGENITKETLDKFYKVTEELLNEVDDHIIMIQKQIYQEDKVKLLNTIRKKDIRDELVFEEDGLYYKGDRLINLNSKSNLKIITINDNKDELEIRGTVSYYLRPEEYQINVVINNKKRIKLDLCETNINVQYFYSERFYSSKGFIVKIPKKDLKSIQFEFEYKKENKVFLNFSAGFWGKIDKTSRIYYVNDGLIYTCKRNKIVVTKDTTKNRLYHSFRLLVYLVKKFKFKFIFYRFLYHLCKLFNKKKIWLITDRPTTANDNGYAFFKYLSTNPEKTKNIDYYFVIAKKSQYIDKVKNTGKYVIYNSLKYKIKYLLADKIISSQADWWLANPFGRNHCLMHDLYKADQVFLQHGITKDDISDWINPYEKNIKLFITAANNEYKSIINGNYKLTDKEVKLTGFSRYDLLDDKADKLITIMPTWRVNLAYGIDPKTGERPYYEAFKDSDYYKEYNNIINNQKLLEAMKKHGYKGLFVVHPCHIANTIDFEENDLFKVLTKSAEYSEIFSKSSLLITDYSSVAFDFAYLKKPIIYLQSDKKEFFETQLYKEGYFSYEKDGFGPVITEENKIVDEIIKTIENNCKLDKKYEKRIQKFYAYNDRNNSERIYNEIIKIDKEK